MIVSISISLFLLQVIFMKSSNCDYYTSIAGLDDVLSVEFYLIELFDVYITQAEEVNNAVKRIVFDMEKEMNSSLTLLETHYQNPLHAFKILKRLVVDWKQVEKLFITNEIAEVFSQNLTKLEGVGFKWPTREDLQGASNGLVRLQQTYNISTNDIANGTALGKVLSRQLSAADCFELGVTLYETSNFQFAIEWLMKAKVRLENESLDINYTLTFPRVFDAQILHYLSLTMFSIGNLKMAQRFNFKLLIQDPESQEGLQNKIIILQNLLDDRRTLYVTDSNQKKDNLQELYEKVCRKEITQTPTQQRVLHCRYVTNNTPFATIAPFKMEILNQDPLVAYYHEAIYENEINYIINKTVNIVERSKIGDRLMQAYSEIRTSKNSWLHHNDHKYLENLRQRLHDITLLDLTSAEALQVANYGIGGHYGPHYDFSEIPDSFPGTGNRILTALFYINDVELGGATAFPFLHLSVSPIRRSVLIWYNMHESLEYDYRTKHAGCPVLKGSKWICNEWFHEIGQEFKRPCMLQPNGNISIDFCMMWKTNFSIEIAKTIHIMIILLMPLKHMKALELHENLKLPYPDDLMGAARGIARLQKTYRLKTEDVRQGYIRKIKASPPLSSSDAFYLGLNLMQTENYVYAMEWLTESLKISAQELLSQTYKSIDSLFIEEEQILEQLAAASYFNGDLIFANWLTKQMLQLNSTNLIASENAQFYSEAMSKARFRLEHTTQPQLNVVDRKKEIMIKAVDQYEKVCSGEVTQTPAQQRNLRCKYSHNNVPFCMIGPFKLEELCLEPYIARYYDIISDSEIKEILFKSTKSIERSRVFGASTEERIYSEMRISKNSWLWYHQNPSMNNLKQRLEDISGLRMDFSTALQVANYGIGGHYEPHCDFRYTSKEFGSRGNRVKTALLYLNKVEMGGATAFPFLSFAAEPIRGSLIIWRNLHKSGEGDYRTRHGSCPVLKGTKWIGTEWIHEYGQILNCDLKSDSYLSLAFVAPGLSSVIKIHFESRYGMEIKYCVNLNDIDSTEIYLHIEENLLIQTKQQNEFNKNNPLLMLEMLKRLSLEWNRISSNILNNSNVEGFETNIKTYFDDPTELYQQPEYSDLIGAGMGLVRLQKTYKLPTSEIANGTLLGKKYSAILTACDCFEFGKLLHKLSYFKNAKEWFLLSHTKFVNEMGDNCYPQLKVTDILNYIFNSTIIEDEFNFQKKSLTTFDQDEYTYDEIIAFDTEFDDDELNQEYIADHNELMSNDLYEGTCRGEYVQTATEKRLLRCKYVHNNVAYRIIGPFKLEEYNLKPYIVQYYDVISNTESDYIIDIAYDNLNASRIGDNVVDTNLRTSKNTWLDLILDKNLINLSDRLTDMTGLNLEYSEALQIANYGIGGHYDPHFDFTEDVDLEDLGEEGNRILTALFYINDVDLGGSTAFPFLRINVPPIKNSLLVWHNLHRSGSPDYRTLHASCPRLTTDWTQIIDYAEKLEPSEVEMNLMAMEENLAYPTERDYDESVANLLRLQQFYNLEPEHLSIGEMNGIKFGSEMTWSDCLEIGRQSLIIGNQNIAKFWIELALSKLPTTSKNISSTAKNTIFEVLKAVLNTEYASGNFNKSHDIVKKMLELKPTHKGAQKAKTQIESKVRSKTGESKKNIEKKKKLKTTEEVWFEEICREATFTTQAPLSISAQKLCKLDRGNFPQLFLQPLKVEFLSVNPLIVIYHEIFTLKQLDNLRNLLKIFKSDNRAVEEYQIEDILMSIKQILQLVTGYSSIKLSDWKTDCNSFENFGPFDAEYYKITSANIIGTTFLNFQASKLGGAIVFPQLEVGINIPVRSLLYWSNLNEFHEVDYRTEAHLCPVIIGTQIRRKKLYSFYHQTEPRMSNLSIHKTRKENNISNFIIISALILFVYVENVYASNEYYSSVSGLEDLLNTEAILLQELQEYVNGVSKHLSGLQSEIDAIQKEHLSASLNLDGYLNNPVNSYRLIKRLHNDWGYYEETVRNETSRTSFLESLEEKRYLMNYPSENDLFGAAVALVRLQETYKLDVTEVASGILNGIKYGTAMSWQDCFTLAHNLYEMRDFNHTVSWLKQSMKMLSSEQYSNDPLALDYMEIVSTYHQEMGDFHTALQLINNVLSVDTERENLIDTKYYLKQMLTSGVKKGFLFETKISPDDYRQTNEFKLYEKVCRNEIVPTRRQQRPLLCKYHTNGLPYLLLQPFKLEEYNLEPYVAQFYDVITEREIIAVKRLSKLRLKRSKVRNPNGSDSGAIATYRTSKSAFFKYNEHRYIQNMLFQFELISGLNVINAEDLQVANYGIGGHYEPHWDFFTDNTSYNECDGNRVTTAIYYLSDVEEGGSTAFPFLNVLVKPKKGSLLFWYNLHSSGDPDYRTKHAACPVLKGTKWIANIWLRIRDQIWNRPCSLISDHNLSITYRDYD
ncbi:uncharacterized protein LOC119676931 [Teleopsis dalmanni]|uniref:uncharacterized protein LOC119676931 n=1 Tax=Teleopsis dalmanni TaxID=139649 RepID=UPI0018CCFAB4|nr:uncharacterized protein LOC119676931 [Teleopsis dalmanni]